MQIESVPETALSAATDRDIADLLARCFQTDFGGKSYFTHRHHLRLIAREKGVLVGHMALLLRAVTLGDRLVTIAGLAEVATDPNHRGKGIAAALLDAAIQAARASLAEHFVLFGVAKLYAAAGFRNVYNPMTYHELSGGQVIVHRDQRVDSLMVLPLSGRDWPEHAPLDLRGPMF